MRAISGFVCVGRLESNRVLFGKTVHNVDWRCESLETNGILPFDTLTDASRAAKELRKRRFQSVVIRILRMQIAETIEDITMLHQRRKLIVVMHGEDETPFWGQPFPTQSTTLYASRLTINSLKPFFNFAAAERCAREVRRQGQSRASIATFHLKPASVPSRSAKRQRPP